MRRASLLLCLLASVGLVVAADLELTPEDYEARAAWAWAMKPPEIKPRVIRTVTTAKVVERGYHSHACPYCKTVWSHGESSRGNLAAHTCPKCNRVLPSPWYPLR